MFKRLVIFVLVFASLTAGIVFSAYRWSLAQPMALPPEGVIVEVARGEALASVLTRLKDKGYLPHTWGARLYARQHPQKSRIKFGEFELPAGTTVPALFSILSSQQQVRYKLTLVEGSTFAEGLAQIRSTPNIQNTLAGKTDLEILTLLRNQSAELDGEPANRHPEGMLYPDTYYFHKNDSDLSILLRAHQRLLKVLAEEWQNKAPDLPILTAYEALTLASIVEKETGKPDERTEIAGVFIRRLNKNMRLQTDPTVIYGLGAEYQGNITRQHLLTKTAYNTYRINGLPPTPIALAGRAAIHAALQPKAGESLYFVAKGDGSHQFSANIGEHNRAVRKYQLKRRADYRSSHQTPQVKTP